jgi:hypothetical protein
MATSHRRLGLLLGFIGMTYLAGMDLLCQRLELDGVGAEGAIRRINQ